MIAELGYVFLIISLIASFLQFIMPFNKFFSPVKFPIFISSVVFISFAGAFFCLLYSYVISDFSVRNVFENSHTDKPLLYKVTGTWGNHEGSMLLFITLLSMITFLFGKFSVVKNKKNILSIQGGIIFGLAAYIFFTSNPFERIFPVPANGTDLNPLLQDIGLAMHPPTLYMGYVGFSLAFSFAVTGLLEGNIDKKWASGLKPWIMVSWSFLTLGIGLGSWWAYRELGWGGFWFWDPVENSSLLPWLAGTALLHCIIVLEKRNSLVRWTSFLSIITFCLSLIGFFLVRSGVLTSVHAFASDPYRGIFMLIFIAVVVGSSLVIYAIKLPKIAKVGNFDLISKEGGILFNNLLLITLCGTVLLGTVYPIFLEVLTGNTVSVGAPYFNAVFLPIALPILLLSAIGPLLKWKKDNLISVFRKLNISFSFALIVMIAIWLREGEFSVYVIAFGGSAWLFSTTVIEFLRSSGLVKGVFKKLPAPFYAMTISHLGVAVLAFSITALTIGEEEKELLMKIGEKTSIAGHEINFIGTKVVKGENYLSRKGTFSVFKNGKEVTNLNPESRIYFVQGTHTTEADVYYNILYDLYIVIGDKVESYTGESGNGFSIRIYIKPFMLWVWIGCIMIACGGLVSCVHSFRKTK